MTDLSQLSPIQQAILTVLSDGKPKTRDELKNAIACEQEQFDPELEALCRQRYIQFDFAEDRRAHFRLLKPVTVNVDSEIPKPK